ncbi:hypothetical protein B0H19DRAFT_1197001 [Mycena capillaripes]|nr:hypothetical protein B0H19DRAFT_1197001 [Mycena capillaripes]
MSEAQRGCVHRFRARCASASDAQFGRCGDAGSWMTSGHDRTRTSCTPRRRMTSAVWRGST